MYPYPLFIEGARKMSLMRWPLIRDGLTGPSAAPVSSIDLTHQSSSISIHLHLDSYASLFKSTPILRRRRRSRRSSMICDIDYCGWLFLWKTSVYYAVHLSIELQGKIPSTHTKIIITGTRTHGDMVQKRLYWTRTKRIT